MLHWPAVAFATGIDPVATAGCMFSASRDREVAMRVSRLVPPIFFTSGLLTVLLAAVFLLTEKIVIYPHERSLPLLNLSRVEEASFKTFSQVPGLHPREAISPSELASCSMALAGVLLCFYSGRSIVSSRPR